MAVRGDCTRVGPDRAFGAMSRLRSFEPGKELRRGAEDSVPLAVSEDKSRAARSPSAGLLAPLGAPCMDGALYGVVNEGLADDGVAGAASGALGSCRSEVTGCGAATSSEAERALREGG